MTIYRSASVGVPFPLQTAATTGSGFPAAVTPSVKNLLFHCKGTGTISGGTISLEEAESPDYTGTWSVLGTVTASGLTGGAEQDFHYAGNFKAVRARITSDITGGGSISVDVTVGN